MKNFKFLIFLFALAVFTTSCKEDPCEDVTCLNGGVCDEGICDCPVGYVGAKCDQRVNFNILGVKDTLVYLKDTTRVPLQIVWIEGPKETVTLTVTDLPAGVTAFIEPNTATPDFNATLLLIGDENLVTGTYNNLNVHGTIGSGLTISKNFNITAEKNCRPFFVGTYNVTDVCGSGTYTFQTTLKIDPTVSNRILMDNFGDNSGYNVYAVINCDNNTITIPAQSYPGVTISGSGTINIANESMTISSTYQFSGFDNNCNATYIKL